MDAFKVNTESWHYRFNTIAWWKFKYIEPFGDKMPKDFCTYWRHVIYSCIMAVFATLYGLSVVALIGMLMFMIGDGFWNYFEQMMFGIGVMTTAGVLLTIIYFPIYPYVIKPAWGLALPVRNWIKYPFTMMKAAYTRWKSSRVKLPKKVKSPKKAKSISSTPKQPSLIKTKYKSWKSKYCPMVEYE